MARPRPRRRDDRVERKPKKRVSILDSEQITYVDYKDVNLLRRFMSERAKIRARRVTGNDTQQQREIARAIRVAREMALLPYSVRQVTHRSKRRTDRPERDGAPGAAAPTGAEGTEGIEVEIPAEELEVGVDTTTEAEDT
ncbi:MAG: 30S ribosomal protein S18 [Actinobacteria bacterium]|nr:30S ribosomal protein S18 [Actinomycetota bacterium]